MKDKILAALPKLNKKDLQQVVSVASTLLEANSDDRVPILWFDAVSAALNSRHGWTKASKSSTGKHLRGNAPDAEAFLNSLINKALIRKLGRAAIRRHLVELLDADLRGRDVTPSIGILATNLPRLSEVFDTAYPGWRGAGLTQMIIERIVGGKT